MTDGKSTMRASMRKLLKSLSSDTCHSNSLQICHHLEQSSYLSAAEAVLTFAALPGEPDLLPLFNKLSIQQTFCFPRVTGSNLEIRRVSDSSNLIPGYASIHEPSPEYCPLFPTQKIQVILLPGLAFDPSNGGRLGKGKGFYDKLLNQVRTNPEHPITTLGVCFSCQLKNVVTEAHDQNVDAIVTENGLILPRKSL